MTKSIFDLFHEIFNDYERFCNDEFLESLLNKKEVKDEDKEKDYEFFKSDKYVDGKHVYHKEKETVDGKVTKDVSYNPSKTIENKQKTKEEDDELVFDVEPDTNVDELEERVKELKETCDGLVAENKEYEKTISRLENENFELREKIESIKNIFC